MTTTVAAMYRFTLICILSYLITNIILLEASSICSDSISWTKVGSSQLDDCLLIIYSLCCLLEEIFVLES